MTYSNSINMCLSYNVLVATGEKGNEIIIQNKEMAAVFINIAKNGFTYVKPYVFVFTGYVSCWYFFSLYGCHVFIFPLFSMSFSP